VTIIIYLFITELLTGNKIFTLLNKRASSVGKVTGYKLDDQCFVPGSGIDLSFVTTSRPAL